MSYSNGVVKDTGANDGVSVYDVQQALGNVSGGGTALTVNSLNGLCTHTNINMWAKYKPIQYPVVYPITLRIRRGTDFPIIGKSYGLETIVKNNRSFSEFYSEIFSMVYTTGNPYRNGVKYNKPAGATVNSNNEIVGSPYRIGDFGDSATPNLGYYHAAQLQHGPSDSSTINWTIHYAFSTHGATVAINDDTEYKIFTAQDIEQEETAWANHNPDRDVSSDTANERNLSVSVLDILAPSSQLKSNFFDSSRTAGNKVILNRGFLMLNGSAFRWCVMPNTVNASIPFGYWKTHPDGDTIVTDGWSFVEFYTNAPVGNYENTMLSGTYNYYLIPDSVGTLNITIEGGVTPNITILDLGVIIPGTNRMPNTIYCDDLSTIPSTGITVSTDINGADVVTRNIHASDFDASNEYSIVYDSNPQQYIGQTITIRVTDTSSGSLIVSEYAVIHD